MILASFSGRIGVALRTASRSLPGWNNSNEENIITTHDWWFPDLRVTGLGRKTIIKDYNIVKEKLHRTDQNICKMECMLIKKIASIGRNFLFSVRKHIRVVISVGGGCWMLWLKIEVSNIELLAVNLGQQLLPLQEPPQFLNGKMEQIHPRTNMNACGKWQHMPKVRWDSIYLTLLNYEFMLAWLQKEVLRRQVSGTANK